MNAKEAKKEEAKNFLKKYLKPGDTVYTHVEHVSRSGMYRVIRLYVIDENQPMDISYTASILLEGYDEKHNGCRASGCGMDMGFALVYALSRRLFEEFYCIGKGEGYICLCPSNDHLNWREDNSHNDYSSTRLHSDSGYALRQKWL